jgi:undecaprenyl-diphosphatase
LYGKQAARDNVSMTLTMDQPVAHAANHFAWTHDWLGDLFELYAKASEPLFVALVVILLVAGIWRRRLLWTGLMAGAAAAAGLLVAVVAAHLVDRPRPFVADPGRIHALVKHAADSGFPSDHATAAFAIATMLFLFNRRAGAIALIAAALLAITRVAVGVHYPTDVLAGAILGVGAAYGLFILSQRSGLMRRIGACQPLSHARDSAAG